MTALPIVKATAIHERFPVSETEVRVRPGSNLDYPFESRPEIGQTIEVVPGVHWEDLNFLTPEGLKAMFSGVEGGEARVAELCAHLKKT